jgi:hypothetical protein
LRALFHQIDVIPVFHQVVALGIVFKHVLRFDQCFEMCRVSLDNSPRITDGMGCIEVLQ